ncbi:MAG TPA: hypothetical protein VGD65_08420 [Chryseosolibacter sp.]
MLSRITTVAMLFTVLSTSTFADVTPSIKVVPATAGNIFTLHYQAPSAGNVKVSILDKNNEVVFSELISEAGAFTRPYNFSQLEKGEYKIIVQDRSGRQEQVVKYGLSESKSYIKISEMNKEESRFVLNIGTSSEETVIVRIYDNAKGLVHEQEIEVNGNYGLIYNLSKVRSSQKSIVMFEVSTSAGQVQTAMF